MERPIGRRAVLGAALAGVGLAGVTRADAAGRALPKAPGFQWPSLFYSPAIEKFTDELPPLPILSGRSFDLAARVTKHRFHSSLPVSPALGYGGREYLGPVLEVQRDDDVRVIFRNRMLGHPFAKDIDDTVHGVTDLDRYRPRSVLHLHGGVNPPEHDGHPQAVLLPGADTEHRFPFRQEAAGLWYHDHAIGMTRLNVYAGLAGQVLLRDRWDTGRAGNPLGLPAGPYELPLVMQEKIFTESGIQSIRSTPIVPRGRWEGGAVGDTGMVNGVVWPDLKVARGLYRFRVINAASFSVWNLFLSNRMPYWVIGTDGGLLDAPAKVTSFRLAPGERADLLVDFSGLRPGESVELRNDEQVPGQAAIIGAVIMPVFCRFTATAARGHTAPVPARLRGGRGLPPALPAGLPKPERVRRVTITQPNDFARLPPSIMTLNNVHFDGSEPDRPRPGSVEVWELINVTPDPHPIHLHLVTFRILGRQPFNSFDYITRYPQPDVGTEWRPSANEFTTGPMEPPAPYEAGLKDTVRADGWHITRILVQWPTADELGFDPDATFSAPALPAGTERMGAGGHHSGGGPLQGYVYHCHVLDHEDHDMMLRYRLG